jgi:hypothetical protein
MGPLQSNRYRGHDCMDLYFGREWFCPQQYPAVDGRWDGNQILACTLCLIVVSFLQYNG